MSKLERLKEKWGLNSLFQVVLVLIAFSLAGSSVVIFRKFFFSLIGINDSPFWLKTIAYILIVFPAYQVLLLAYGTLLGQFHFFWDKEKKLFKRLMSMGKKKNKGGTVESDNQDINTSLNQQSA